MAQYQDIDRSGNFRGEIIDYGLTEQESGAVAVGIEVHIHECWNAETKEWEDWRQYAPMRAVGYIYVIKKDGTLNDKQVQSLVQHAAWDGSFESIVNHTWQPSPVHIVVDADTYKGKVQYKINWLNDFDRQPGGIGQIASGRMKDLNAKYGSQLRAVAGSAKKQAVPNGKPAAPPPAREKVTAENTPKDDIPF